MWDCLQQGEALMPLRFIFTLEYTIRKIQENQGGLKLDEAHHLLVYTEYELTG